MTTPSHPDVVIGEMRPWSDRSEGSTLAGGPVLAALLDDVSTTGTVLVLGPTQDEIVTRLVESAERVDLLVRSTTDAESVRALHGDRVNVTVGGLEDYAVQQTGAFDLVVALDGLDRVLSFETAPLPWRDVLDLVNGLVAADGRLVLGHALELGPLVQLDARPPSERRGDDDFHPFEVDARRPVDATQFVAALSEAGLSLASGTLLFGPPSAPRAAWSMAAASRDSSFSVPLRAALLAQACTATPLLASPEEMTRAYFAAGRAQDAADGVLVVAQRSAVVSSLQEPDLTAAVGDLLLRATHDAAEREWDLESVASASVPWPDVEREQPLTRETAQPSESFRYVTDAAPAAAPVAAREDLVPRRVADGPSVGDELRRLAALGDVPAFRELAGRVGDFVAAQPAAAHRVFDFDDLHLTPNGVTLGFSGLAWTSPASSEEALAAAWFLFDDDLQAGHRRHPWPSWVMGAPNVASWLEAAGASSEGPVVDRGQELAAALIAHRRAAQAPVPALRTALADAEAARREVMELQGHIAGLERTIGFRDKQLKSRGDVIRKLRNSPGAGVSAASASSLTRLAKRTAQVRSVDELTAGLNRVARRAKRKLGQ